MDKSFYLFWYSKRNIRLSEFKRHQRMNILPFPRAASLPSPLSGGWDRKKNNFSSREGRKCLMYVKFGSFIWKEIFMRKYLWTKIDCWHVRNFCNKVSIFFEIMEQSCNFFLTMPFFIQKLLSWILVKQSIHQVSVWWTHQQFLKAQK